jgi:glycosyltransferase involved in cell wall biosynthesis
MKIVHFHPDGRMAARFVGPLIDAERDASYNTQLVTSVCRQQQAGIVIPFDLSAANLLGLPLALWKVWSLLKRIRPDAVISHNTKSSLLPLLGASLAGVRVRVYFNHGVPYVGYRGRLRWLLRKLERFNCSLATHVVTVSVNMKALLQDAVPWVKPMVIESGSASGIDLSLYAPHGIHASEWRSTLGLAETDFVVVYVGRPERRKGFDIVLRLWADNLKEPAFKLILCGPEREDALRYIPTVPSNVLCLGFVDNVPDILRSADVLILPSLHEGLSYACMEAQASGAVVVGNNVSGISCLIEDGVSGFLVDGNSPDKYVEIIRALEANRSTLATVSAHARTRMVRFSRQLFIPAYLKLLQSFLSKSV